MPKVKPVMKLDVDRSALLAELNACRAFEKHSTIPILSCFLLKAENGLLHVSSTDLEDAVCSRCDASVKLAGAVAVPGTRLLEYVELLPEGQLSIEADTSFEVKIASAGSVGKIRGMNPGSFPNLPDMPAPLFQFSLRAFAEMVRRTIFAVSRVSKEGQRFALDGALLNLTEAGRLILAATDGCRLAITKTATLSFSERESSGLHFLLSRSTLSQFVRLAKSTECSLARFAHDANHGYFDIDGRILCFRKTSGQFPNINRVMPKGYANSVSMPREAIKIALMRAAKFASEDSRLVRLTIADGVLKISASVFETSDLVESIPVNYTGPGFEIGLNYSYLLDYLTRVESDDIKLHFENAASPIGMEQVRDPFPEDIGYRYVVMPMRV